MSVIYQGISKYQKRNCFVSNTLVVLFSDVSDLNVVLETMWVQVIGENYGRVAAVLPDVRDDYGDQKYGPKHCTNPTSHTYQGFSIGVKSTLNSLGKIDKQYTRRASVIYRFLG